MLCGQRIGITGVTGFLGRYIARALHARRAKVIGIARRPKRVPQLEAWCTEIREADLLDEKSLKSALQGLDVLVSNAALFSIGSFSWQAHQALNLQGTGHLLKAMAHAGIPRLLHVSSIAVYKRSLVNRSLVLNEESEMLGPRDRRPWNAYPFTKAMSERLVWERCREMNISLTCMRPGPIYGAFDPNCTALLRRGFSLPIACTPAYLRLPFVYAGDVAQAIARALERAEVTCHRAYNVAGESDLSIRQWAGIWKKAGGHVSRLRFSLPVPMMIRVDNTRAYRELGWRARTLIDGLCESFEEQPELKRGALC